METENKTTPSPSRKDKVPVIVVRKVYTAYVGIMRAYNGKTIQAMFKEYKIEFWAVSLHLLEDTNSEDLYKKMSRIMVKKHEIRNQTTCSKLQTPV